jgi:IPT/TIG domain
LARRLPARSPELVRRLHARSPGRAQRLAASSLALACALMVCWALASVAVAAEPVPTLTKLEPSEGPAAGGTSVTITGSGFTEAASVKFGATPASVKYESPTQLKATSPAGSGTVEVSVSTTGGTSAPSAADRFTYIVVPTPASVKQEEPQKVAGENLTPAKEAVQKEKDEAQARVYQETVWAAALDGARQSGGVLGALGSLLAPDATQTLAKDEQVTKDPSLPEYEVLAQPKPISAKVLPSCGRSHSPAASRCRRLRAVEGALLAQGAKSASITAALYTTISRQTAAIDAGDGAAAEDQDRHFSALNSELNMTFSAQAEDGPRLATLLPKAHLNATISQSKMAKALKSLERELAREGVVTASISSLAGSALTPKATNFLNVLAEGKG